MIFLDASAAAKRYFQEIGSEQVQELWSLPQGLLSLEILRCELASVLNRKLREHALTHNIYEGLKKQVREDLKDLGAVPADSSLIQTSLRLLESHPLKALDSLYLAGALNLQQIWKSPVLFVSADRQLLRAAKAEGLQVLNPEAA